MLFKTCLFTFRSFVLSQVILLLTELTKANANIQKIVAFENAFDWLLKIIYSEGLCDGSVVVEDCLRLLFQLLDGNPSNQVLFAEGNFIQRLSLLFDLHSTESTQSHLWSAQKVVNAEVAMQVSVVSNVIIKFFQLHSGFSIV